MKQVRETMLYFVLAMSLILSLLYLTGCITSFGQLVDDHEIIEWNSSSFSSALGVIQSDYNVTGRYRPLYIVFRLIKIALFHDNYVLWHIWHAFLFAIASSLLFLYARIRGIGAFSAVLLSAVVLIGPQTEVMWRLGPQEIQGTILFTFALISIHKWLSLTPISQRRLWLTLAVLSSCLASLYKESFAILTPMLMVYAALLQFQLEPAEENLSRRFAHAIRNTDVFHACLCIITAINAYFIIHIVRQDTMEYATHYVASEQERSLFVFLKGIIAIFRRKSILSSFLFIGLLLCLILFLSKRFLDEHWTLIPVGMLIVTQLVIYNKSGMIGRYYLPLTLSFILIYIIVLQNSFCYRAIPILIMILYIGFSFIHDALPRANEYGLKSNEDSNMIDYVKSAIPEGSVITLDGVDLESRLSIKSYLTYDHYTCDLFGIDDNGVCIPIGSCVNETPSEIWSSDYVISGTPYEIVHDDFVESYHGTKWFVYQNTSTMKRLSERE